MHQTSAPPRDGAFDVASILAEAAMNGVSDPDHIVGREALDRLAHALDTEAKLTSDGRKAVRNSLIGALTIQARAAQMRSVEPAIATTPITAPVFITGMLRTGTTLIHNLLAEHPDLRAPRLWELTAPVSSRQGEQANQNLVRDSAAYVAEYNKAAPALASAHFLDALRPDECQRLTGAIFTSMIYELRYDVPSYGHWLYQQDQVDAYAYHRLLLQHILWRQGGGTVVMKCPFHLWRLGALVETYPDARIIHMHRSPAVTIPSTCSLTEIVRGARSDRIDRPAIGRLWSSRIEDAISELPAVRTGALADTPVLDVSYSRLMADPLAMVGEICDFIGVPLTAAAERAMRDYLAANPQRKHGAHQYKAEDYGLDTVELERRFGDYTTQFAS